MDTCGFFHTIGDELSIDIGSNPSLIEDMYKYMFGETQQASYIGTFQLLRGGSRTTSNDDANSQPIQDCTDLCIGYNITLADSDNGTSTETVTTDKCGGTTLQSFIIGNSSEFSQVKNIYLQDVRITKLTVRDLSYFPELEVIVLYDIPIHHMDDGLLCYNMNITILNYVNSLGQLTSFPQQIFNCTVSLKLEYILLRMHDIAYLPAHAFGMATKQLKFVGLNDIGLQAIHKDAFLGMTNVQALNIIDNKLSQMTDVILLPSNTQLHWVKIINDLYTRELNLTAMDISSQTHLKGFQWESNHVSDVIGNFCSKQSPSKTRNDPA